MTGRPVERRGDVVLVDVRAAGAAISAREIARTLWISPNTVRKHLENAFAKLGVHTRTAAAARLLRATVD